jgi:hypothetical protein
MLNYITKGQQIKPDRLLKFLGEVANFIEKIIALSFLNASYFHYFLFLYMLCKQMLS